MPDISEDSAIFGIITAFPGCNPDFMLGFEAGMVWGQLWSSKNPIKIIIEIGISGFGPTSVGRDHQLPGSQMSPPNVMTPTGLSRPSASKQDNCSDGICDATTPAGSTCAAMRGSADRPTAKRTSART